MLATTCKLTNHSRVNTSLPLYDKHFRFRLKICTQNDELTRLDASFRQFVVIRMYFIILCLRTYLENRSSCDRINEEHVFKTTKLGDLAHRLSNSIDIERITITFDSEERFSLKTTI